MLVATRWSFLVLGASVLAGLAPSALTRTPLPPVTVYAELDGTWEGTFVGWDTSGHELYRIAVRQTYRTVDAHTQTVEIEDRMPDGTVITGRGENFARRTEGGDLELRCVVVKSNGDRVEHEGRLIEGPDGSRELVWHSRSGEREEMFRERVRSVNGHEIYQIDGVGRYGDQVVVMAGRYRRVAQSGPEPAPEATP